MKRFLKIGLIILGLWSFSSILGLMLGVVGKCKASVDRENKIIFFSSCGGFTENFLRNGLKAGAVTFGNTVLTMYSRLPSNVYKHELQHVKQYLIFGPLFLPAYGVAHLMAYIDSKIDNYENVHAGNFFEIWANKWAGLKPESKYF
ncbi:MAG: hypothetical protein PHX34_02825 [Candidatus Shapirobacteria bacterium]|nr:hypothetical protein [Candidatus Shapirobacteria bacterium]